MNIKKISVRFNLDKEADSKVYCSESCRKEAQRIMNAARVRKHREKKEGER